MWSQSSMSKPKTLLEKIWDTHVVIEGEQTVVYIDLHLIHEVTSPQAFTGLKEKGLKVRRPDKTFATIDHSLPTLIDSSNSRLSFADSMAVKQIEQLISNCKEFGIELYGLDSPHQGIVHVIGPELGLTQPGYTIVCGDSHTATHGAFGALAFGIGTTEVEQVLATQCLFQKKPKNYAVNLEGKLRRGVSAKDIILALIAKIGIDGATGHVFEYRGDAIKNLSMEERMTICNMSIEAGARAGMVAPDETTFDYLYHRPLAPKGAAWKEAVSRWKRFPTDEGAIFDKEVTIDVSSLEPMITFGTNPAMAIPISARVPDPESIADSGQKSSLQQALSYMDISPGRQLLDHPIDTVFIGSCTNSRLSDLEQAAKVFKGRKVAVKTLVVPGSQSVKKEAEDAGIDLIFKEAGAEWREPGCSMCIAMNGDQVAPGKYSVSTSNRNFEGRQGKGARTFLASPLTAAAAAITGKITDIRSLEIEIL